MFGGHSEAQLDDLLGLHQQAEKEVWIGLSYELVSNSLSKWLFYSCSSLALCHFVRCSLFGWRWSTPPGGCTMARAGICLSNGPKHGQRSGSTLPARDQGLHRKGLSVVVTCNWTVCLLKLFVVQPFWHLWRPQFDDFLGLHQVEKQVWELGPVVASSHHFAFVTVLCLFFNEMR
jgi:hypothetical protein